MGINRNVNFPMYGDLASITVLPEFTPLKTLSKNVSRFHGLKVPNFSELIATVKLLQLAQITHISQHRKFTATVE